jgi:hypothetical protein
MMAALQAFLGEEHQLDEKGRIKLQYTEGSDYWYSISSGFLAGYDEDDESTIPEGFRLHIQTGHFPTDGSQPYLQTLLQRPLGHFITTPSELYDKIGVIDAAWAYQPDMRCCPRQLQILLVKRKREYTPRDENGKREATATMVPTYTSEDLEKRGGLIDLAFFMLEGVEGSIHDGLRRPKATTELLEFSMGQHRNRKIFQSAANALEAQLGNRGPLKATTVQTYFSQRSKDERKQERAQQERPRQGQSHIRQTVTRNVH